MATGPDVNDRFAVCPVTLPGTRRDSSLYGRLKTTAAVVKRRERGPEATEEVAMDAAVQAAARRCHRR